MPPRCRPGRFEIDQATVDADPHVDGHAQLAFGLFAELRHGPDYHVA